MRSSASPYASVSEYRRVVGERLREVLLDELADVGARRERERVRGVLGHVGAEEVVGVLLDLDVEGGRERAHVGLAARAVRVHVAEAVVDVEAQHPMKVPSG